MPRPLVTVAPLQHCGARRIKVDCPFGEVVIFKIKMDEENGRTGAKPYAPHRAGNGYRLKLVQEALGHASIKMAEIYLPLTSNALNILKSPIDNLKLK